MDFTREKHQPVKAWHENPLVEKAEFALEHPIETIRDIIKDNASQGGALSPLQYGIDFVDSAGNFLSDAAEFLDIGGRGGTGQGDGWRGSESGAFPHAKHTFHLEDRPAYGTAPETDPRDKQFNISYVKSKQHNRSFAGCDIVPTLTIPGQPTYTFGDISTLSVSTHRESFPVRMMGRTNPLGFTRGPRMIAGTIIFSLIDMYPWYKMIKNADAPVWQHSNTYPLADSLPPFDITVTFHNEYEEGGAVMRIFGVVIIDDGMALSIDDLVTENTYSYMAAGIAPVHQQTAWNIERLIEGAEYGLGDLMRENPNAVADFKGTLQTWQANVMDSLSSALGSGTEAVKTATGALLAGAPTMAVGSSLYQQLQSLQGMPDNQQIPFVEGLFRTMPVTTVSTGIQQWRSQVIDGLRTSSGWPFARRNTLIDKLISSCPAAGAADFIYNELVNLRTKPESSQMVHIQSLINAPNVPTWLRNNGSN